MKSKRFLLLLLILIIAGFLRLYQITATPPGLYPDEAVNGNDALQAWRTHDFKVFYPENNGREGLFMDIQALFLAAFKVNEPWVLRLPSAIFGILTVLGLYFLARELFSERVALLSSFFLAVSFWHILFSRIGFRAIMAPFFLVWALYFFLKSLNPKPYTLYPIIAGIFYGLGFYSYIAYRITPLLFLTFIPFYRNDKKFWRATAVLAAAAFIVALPIGIYFLQHRADFFGRTSEVSIFSSPTPLKDLGLNIVKTLGMFNFAGDWNWRQNYAGAPELFWPVGLLFVLGILIGLKKIREFGRRNLEFGILFLWFILALLPVVISDEGIPHALRSILAIPPVFVFAGVGGVFVYDFLKKRITTAWLPFAAFLFLALLFFEAYNTYFVLWAKNPNVAGAFNSDYAEIGRELNALPASAPKYVVVQAGGVLVNGIPMPAQTVMFITDTFTKENQRFKNIHYVLPDEEADIPPGAIKFYLK